jgi:ATP-dependent protease ClpP protease subunit
MEKNSTSTKINIEKISRTKNIESERVVHWTGGVYGEMQKSVLKEISDYMKENKNGEITLVVTSAGGPTGIGMSFYDSVKSIYKPNLHTIGSGDVDSSGITVLLSGNRRSITENTTLLLHLAGRTFDNGKRYTVKDMETMLKEDNLKNYQYASLIAKESNGKLSTEKVLEMMEKETVLTAQEAVHLGIAHTVLQS